MEERGIKRFAKWFYAVVIAIGCSLLICAIVYIFFILAFIVVPLAYLIALGCIVSLIAMAIMRPWR